MANPLTSILMTDWSPQHLTGHDLDGGAIVSYDLDTTLVGTEALGHDQARWSAGDIATLRIAEETGRAELRIVTAKHSVLRVKEFQIFDIAHTVADDRPQKDQGRHIFMQGTAESGATYVLPMLGYTAWTEAWDLTSLQNALTIAQNRNGASSTLAHESTRRKTVATDDGFLAALARCQDIFYPGCKTRTPFEHAMSLTTTCFSVRQSGPEARASMHLAAFIKKSGFPPLPGPDRSTFLKRGTAFSPPYFKVDGKQVFIRTGSALAADAPATACM